MLHSDALPWPSYASRMISIFVKYLNVLILKFTVSGRSMHRRIHTHMHNAVILYSVGLAQARSNKECKCRSAAWSATWHVQQLHAALWYAKINFQYWNCPSDQISCSNSPALPYCICIEKRSCDQGVVSARLVENFFSDWSQSEIDETVWKSTSYNYY